MLLNSRIERRTVVSCRLREANLKENSLAETGVGARSFAGDPEGCCGVAGPGGAQESRSETGRTGCIGDTETDSNVKIRNVLPGYGI